MKFDNQLRYVTSIIGSYQGESPLHIWLKDFFRLHKQMGSRDRKTVSHLVYGFYRLGHAARGMSMDQRILLGLFLTGDRPGEFLEYFYPEWNVLATRTLEEKITFIRESGIDFEPTDIFPWKEALSQGIDHYAFCLSFLRQPDLFLRIRPGYEQQVLQRMSRPSDPVATAAAFAHTFIPPFTLRLPNGFKVEELFTPDKEVVVQDYSSQRIAGLLRGGESRRGEESKRGEENKREEEDKWEEEGKQGEEGKIRFWDTCAASGGKSILAYDLMPGISITVSDIRTSILHNLQQRFSRAGITKYHSFVADLSLEGGTEDKGLLSYNLVLADVPCTGSGTWSRTPEELYFFDPRKILSYSNIQKAILTNIVPRLAPGACLVYSTCSVFKKENEELAAFIRDQSSLREEIAGPIIGYDQKADTMYGARFIA